MYFEKISIDPALFEIINLTDQLIDLKDSQTKSKSSPTHILLDTSVCLFGCLINLTESN